MKRACGVFLACDFFGLLFGDDDFEFGRRWERLAFAFDYLFLVEVQ